MKNLKVGIGLIALLFMFIQPSDILAQRTKRMVVGEISKNELQKQLPNARIQQKMSNERLNVYEVEMTEAEERKIKRNKKVHSTHRYVRMTKAQAQAIVDFGLALAVYAQHHGLHHNGKKWVLGGHMTDGLSARHPHPRGKVKLCRVCDLCEYPDAPKFGDCDDAKLKELWKEYNKFAALQKGLYKALDVYNDYSLTMGVKDMLGNMATAIGFLAPGPGTVASKAAKMLLDMAADAVLSAALDKLMKELGIGDINSKAALEKAIDATNKKLDKLWDQIKKEKERLPECKKKNAKLQEQYEEAVIKYWDCILKENRCRWEKC